MKHIFFISLLLYYFFCTSVFSSQNLNNDISKSIGFDNSEIKILSSEKKNFKPFDCKDLNTKHLRINKKNECLIIQKLNNKYKVKPQKIDPNVWNKPQLLRYLDDKSGGKIITHTWNNIVKWGGNSVKQPFSHLVIINVTDLKKLFKKSFEKISSNHLTIPLTARRLDTSDIDNDGNNEIIYLSNKEDGRNRNNSWKDVNYFYHTQKKYLKRFGTSHFSHDLMNLDFNKDGYIEIIDYFYGQGEPNALEVCDLKNTKCITNKEIGEFVDIGFNHIFPSKNGGTIFGGCPGLGDTSFCWSNIKFDSYKITFSKIDQYKFKPKPKAKAKFKIWTGDINYKPGYWIEGSNKTMFKMADRAWISTFIDFNNDGFFDTIAIEKEVVCKRKNSSKPFNRSGGDCNDFASIYVFKNKNDEKFEKHQVLETSINDAFSIEKADINKDGTTDLYGLVQGYYNPWMACNYPQLKSIYLNKNNAFFAKASENFIRSNFGLYGCERASSFFKKGKQYYRLFITTPYPKSEIAYLGIENYTQK